MTQKYRIETLESSDGTKRYVPKCQIRLFWGLFQWWSCFFDEYDCDIDFSKYEDAEEYLQHQMNGWRITEVKEFTVESI
jgi:hypothetical protein